jgi:hypothetical protein
MSLPALGAVTSPNLVCTGGSWRSFVRSFSDEPKIGANQKQGEMYEAAIKQEFRCHCGKSEERKRNALAKPRKIPARPGCNKKCAGQKLEDISPVDFHDRSLAQSSMSACANALNQLKVSTCRADYDW